MPMDEIRELIAAGRLDEAEHRLRDRLMDAPDDAQALNAFAVVLARKGDLLGARSHFKRAIEAAPEEPSYLVNYGLLLAQQGDSLRATEFLERAAAIDPNWSSAHAQLGEVALATGQMDVAEQRFRTALRADPEDGPALVGLAQVQLARRDLDAALASAQQAMVRMSGDARAQAVLGMVLLAKEHHAFARQALENAVRIEPANDRYRRLLARARLAGNDPQEALTTVLSLSDFSGDDAPMLRQLADALLKTRRDAEVVRLVDHVLPRLPGDVPLVHAGAEARVRLGLIDSAIAWLAAHGGPDAHASIWSHRLALLSRSGRHREALELAREWVAAQPHSAEAQAELATALERHGQHADARKAALAALAIDPGHGKALCLAAAYALVAGAGEREVAELAALEARLPPPVAATRHFLLGLAADRAGDPAQAARHWLDAHGALPPARIPALADPLGPPRELPLPLAVDAEHPPVVFVPNIPGSGVEILLRSLLTSKALAVLGDRLMPGGRTDGLSPEHRPLIEQGLGESTLLMFRRRYWKALSRVRAPTADKVLVDVLPALEWLQYAALSGAIVQGRVLAFVRDPRDALLHWLAYGTAPPRSIGKIELAANYLLRQYQHIDRMRSSAGLAVTVVRGEEFDSDRAGLASRLAQALGVSPEALDLSEVDRRAIGGLPERLKSGRWRHYEKALAKAMKLVQPAAKAFGYE
jgi:tetratricopeptide (TPR) repeat protein